MLMWRRHSLSSTMTCSGIAGATPGSLASRVEWIFRKKSSATTGTSRPFIDVGDQVRQRPLQRQADPHAATGASRYGGRLKVRRRRCALANVEAGAKCRYRSTHPGCGVYPQVLSAIAVSLAGATPTANMGYARHQSTRLSGWFNSGRLIRFNRFLFVRVASCPSVRAWLCNDRSIYFHGAVERPHQDRLGNAGRVRAEFHDDLFRRSRNVHGDQESRLADPRVPAFRAPGQAGVGRLSRDSWSDKTRTPAPWAWPS